MSSDKQMPVAISEGPLYVLEENFFSGNPTKIFSHLGIPRQGRASESLPNAARTLMVSKAKALLSGPSLMVNPSRGTLPVSPRVPADFSGIT